MGCPHQARNDRIERVGKDRGILLRSMTEDDQEPGIAPMKGSELIYDAVGSLKGDGLHPFEPAEIGLSCKEGEEVSPP